MRLGRELASHLEDHDVLGRWMAFHLAHLIESAEADPTDDLRLQVVDTILRIWQHRRYLPEPPFREFAEVLVAIDRLGRPSALVDLLLARGPGLEDKDSFAGMAVEVETLSRETVARLLWMATEHAAAEGEEWLDLSTDIAETVEAAISPAVFRMRFSSSSGEVGSSDGMSDEAHAHQLRAMANRLLSLADTLDVSASSLDEAVED